MSEIAPGEVVITDENYRDFALPPVIDGERKAFGMTRSWTPGVNDGMRGIEPFNLPLIDPNELPARIATMERQKSRLSDLRKIADNGRPAKSYDQGSDGYCWAYSTGAAETVARMVQNQPYKRLSNHGPATIIKGGRDQGGWCGLSARWAYEHGYPTIYTWPEKQRNLRYDTPACREEMKSYKVTDGFWDLRRADYDQQMSFLAVLTCVVNRIACAVDFNWWGHSVCAMDAVDYNPRLPATNLLRYGLRIWNSWTDNWSNMGEGVLTGSRAQPNGAIAVVDVTFSA
jgi:hypothetical protein